jgi:hypothetical protein
MTPHTPGPWTLKLGKYGSPHVISWAPGKTYGQIALVNTPSFQELPEAKTADEVAANARLIASSPLLLKALRDLVSLLGYHQLEMMAGLEPGEEFPEVENAREAIAAATQAEEGE